MGFPKTKATSILSEVFKTGNQIALLSSVDTSSDGYKEVSGDGYARYTIKSGDFSVAGGEAKTANHILFGLAEGSWGMVVGFGVFSSGVLQYLGELTEAKPVGENTVPVFKKYDEASGEGIRVTLDAAEEAAAAVSEGA